MSVETKLVQSFRQSTLTNLFSNHNQWSHSTKPRALFSKLTAYGKGAPGVRLDSFNSFHDFANKLLKRFVILKRLRWVEYCYLINGITGGSTESSHRPALDSELELATLMVHPELIDFYRTFDLPYMYLLAAKGILDYMIEVEDRENVRRAAELTVYHFQNTGNTSWSADHEEKVHSTFNTLYSIIRLGKILDKEIDWKYFKAGESFFFNHVAVGFTHKEVFRWLLHEGREEHVDYFLQFIDGPTQRTLMAHSSLLVELPNGHYRRMAGFKSYVGERVNYPIGSWFWLGLLGKEGVDLVRPGTTALANHPLNDLFIMLQSPATISDSIVDIVRWLINHTQWYNSQSTFVGSCGKEIPVHHHTIIETAINWSYEAPFGTRRLDSKATPDEFMAIWEDEIHQMVDETIASRIDYKPAPFTLETASLTVDGNVETVTFEQLLSSTELEREGHRMKHCIGGYAKKMAKAGNLGFHINSSRVKHGYTAHLIETDEVWSIGQIRGYRNSPVDEVVVEELKRQLGQINNLEEI